jgi:hypothetical protein
MNHFMGRLIFCFFAEDTDIFIVETTQVCYLDNKNQLIEHRLWQNADNWGQSRHCGFACQLQISCHSQKSVYIIE